MSWLDRSDTECQPCDNFTSGDEGYYGPQPHQCYAPFDDPASDRCGKRVYFCRNCNRDHHSGGYNTCLAVYAHCEHPACVQRAAKQALVNSDAVARAVFGEQA